MSVKVKRRAKDGAMVYSAVYYAPDGTRRVEEVRVVPARITRKGKSIDTPEAEHELARAEAEVRDRQQRARIRNGDWKDPRQVKVEAKFLHECIDEFLAHYRTRGGNIEYYEAPAAAWKRHIPDKPIASVSPQDVERFRKRRAADVRTMPRRKKAAADKPKPTPRNFRVPRPKKEKPDPKPAQRVSSETVRKNMVALGKFFRWAKARGYVTTNPADPELAPRPKGSLHRTDYLTREQFTALTNAAPSWLSRVLRWAVATGMDRQEIIGLTWAQIDDAAGVVNAPRLKTGVDRKIPLNKTLRAILEEAKASAAVVRIDRKSHVFLGTDRQPIDVEALKSALRRAYTAAKVPCRQPFKILRHTFASWAAMRGEPLTVLAKLMGHSTAAITERYAHLSPDYLREFMQRQDADAASHPVSHPISEGGTSAPSVTVGSAAE